MHYCRLLYEQQGDPLFVQDEKMTTQRVFNRVLNNVMVATHEEINWLIIGSNQIVALTDRP